MRLAVVPALHLARPGGVYVPSTVEGAIDAARMRADAKVAPTIAPPTNDGTSGVVTIVAVDLAAVTDDDDVLLLFVVVVR